MGSGWQKSGRKPFVALSRDVMSFQLSPVRSCSSVSIPQGWWHIATAKLNDLSVLVECQGAKRSHELQSDVAGGGTC